MAYNVIIERLGISALVDLQGAPSRLNHWLDKRLPPFPETPNTSINEADLSVYWVGPSWWLVRADIAQEQILLPQLQPADAPADISIVQVSDTLEFFSINGPDAGEVISIASAIDHHISAFPSNGVSYTEIFGIKGLLIRTTEGFEIGVERSFANMIEDCLFRAK